VPASGPSAGTVAVYSTNQLDLVLDVVGFYAPGNGVSAGPGNLRFVTPVRVLDTRGAPASGYPGGPIGFNANGTAITPGPLPPGPPRRFLLAGKTFGAVTFPGDLSGVLAHVTIVQPAASGGFVTLYPGDVPDASRPNASTVNPSTPIAYNTGATGTPVSGAAAGTFAVYSTTQLDVIVDVVGYWAASNPPALGELALVRPTRVVDT